MAEASKIVSDAAEFLDSMAGRIPEITPNWRESVDTSTLKMSSAYDCVLGQLFGNYSNGTRALRAADRDGYNEHEMNNAFCDHTAEWKLAVKAPRISENIVWVHDKRELKEVRNVVLDGKAHVAVVDGGGGAIYVLNDFLRYYSPKKIAPTFNKGDVLKSNKGVYFMYESDNRLVNLGTLTWASLHYWTNQEKHVLTPDTGKTGSPLWGRLINVA